MSVHATPAGELSLLEMLADPIIQTEMARDGATNADLDGLIGAAEDNPAGRQSQDSRSGRRETGAIAFGE